MIVFFFSSLSVFLHYLECPSGAFKSAISNTKCVQCPLKSVSNAERTTCTCVEGFYKSFDLADCKGTTDSSVIQHLIVLDPSFFLLGSLPGACFLKVLEPFGLVKPF